MKGFLAAFVTVLINVRLDSGVVTIQDHWRCPSKQGANCGYPTSKELELNIGPLFPARM
jgi:hypothetical protein